MKFRPLHDRVVVKRIDAEEKTAGGIIIPDTAKEKPSQGEVVAVGPGGRDETGKLIPIDVKVGDRVLFGKWSGTEVKIDGVEYLIMKESDIMGVLDATVATEEGRLTPSRFSPVPTAQTRKGLGVAPGPSALQSAAFSERCSRPGDRRTQSFRSNETWLPRT